MRERSRTHLREFQARLNERLRKATTTDVAVRLGLMIGAERYLVDLSEAGEIVPVPSVIQAVPRTREWFRGLVNLRGMLFAVSDLSRLAGDGPTPLSKESRLLAFGARLNFNAAILVTRMLGLHSVDTMRAADGPAPDAPAPWFGRRLVDAEGRSWVELSLSRLCADERFLMVNR
jgi:twitching motility protein PilI